MVNFKAKDALQAAYKAKFPADPSHALWLVGDMAGRHAEARHSQQFLQHWLRDHSGLSLADQTQAEVLDRTAKTDNSIMELVHELARSDLVFEDLTAAQVKAETQLAVLQRQCRKFEVSTRGMMTDARAMQSAIFDSEGWDWDATITGPTGDRGEEDADDDSSDREEEWELVEILDERQIDNGDTEFYVLWKEGSVTWQPMSDLEGTAQEAIDEFRARRAKRAGAGARKKIVFRGGSTGGHGAADTRVDIMLDTMEALSRNVDKFVSAQASKAAPRVDLGAIPAKRPLLKGDVRLKEVGSEIFMAERSLKRSAALTQMPTHREFSDKYNHTLRKLHNKERDITEAEIQFKKLDERGETNEAILKKAELALLKKDWMVYDDKLEFLTGLADMCDKGESLLAWQMWSDAKEENKETSASAEFVRRKKAAAALLKEQAQQR